MLTSREVGARRNEWNKSRKNQKIFLRKKFIVLINSFAFNLFLDMFRNLSSVTYKKLEVHCFIPHLRINKNPRVFDVCFEKKLRHRKFSPGHPTKVAVAFDMIDPGKWNLAWRFTMHCTFDISCQSHWGDNNPGHRANLSLLLKI